MKKAIIFLFYIQVSLVGFGQIIADHTVVDKFDDIPQEYIDEVKKMMVAFMGESHSAALRTGMELLEDLYPAYVCNISTGESYTDQYVRVENYGWIGEDTWFTWYAWDVGSRPFTAWSIKDAISAYSDDGHPFSALGFGWCADMTIDDPSSVTDPVYGVHWYGASDGGPDGNICWGLDDGDYSITGNRVNLETYFNAMEEYIAYCATNSPNTKMVFTTGPVDEAGWWTGENAYQGHIKHEAIRDYVYADASRILFDYADILSYDDDGSLTTQTWNGHIFPSITSTNVIPTTFGHISDAGAIRLAKAQWWMLARIAGWDGGENIPVTSITVTGEGGATTISTLNGTLQLTADVLPVNATNKTVTWSISEGTGQATISSSGLVTAIANGTVTARATANDGSGVYGTLELTLSNQFVPVESITVTGEGGASTISTTGGTLQLYAGITPGDATDKTVSWSVSGGTGQATISSTGLVTALANGTVTARATANDGSGIYGTLVITISNQVVPVESITITSAGGVTIMTSLGGTLQLYAEIAPGDATDKTVNWSVINGTGQATISSAGLVTAVANGTVTARATANDGSGIYGEIVLTISNQVILVTAINVTGAGGSTTINTDDGTLQLSADVSPSDATDKTVTWSIISGTGQATISSTGLVTAVDNGSVTARATANDGSGVHGDFVITISNQFIPVESITVSGAGGLTTINIDNGTLQLSASILPANASDKTLTWSIIPGTGQASVNSTGLVTAIDNGTVTARATANDGSGMYGGLVITISNQVIPVEDITVTGAGGVNTITIDNGTLQLNANVSPSNATDKTVTWSIINGTGEATINQAGLVRAVDNGTVTARATANDGSGVYGALIITLSNQFVPVEYISVTGAGGATLIATLGGTLQLSATILPSNATNQSVTWSITNVTGQATISSSGLVSAVDNGTVRARATANDGSGVYGELVITISNQVIPVTSITVTGTGGSTTINTDNGTLQLNASIAPSNATNQTVTWSVINGTGRASISTAGLVTAIANGTVTARATANDGSGIYGTLLITISNQFVQVTGITVTGDGGATIINTKGGTLQLNALITPSDATNKTVTWSVTNGTGQASIGPTGIVTAVTNGTVTARATANDGSGVYGTIEITILNQIIFVTSITITGEGGSTTIDTENGTLQLFATVLPANATNKTVTWWISDISGQATISPTGLVRAISDGTVRVMATANDGSGVYGTLEITISNQQSIPVTAISITSVGGLTSITEENGTLQLIATITPSNATNKTVTWLIVNGTGEATISPAGLVTAISEGDVTALATANDGSGITSTFDILIEYTQYNDFNIIVREDYVEVFFDEDHTGYQLSLYNLMGELKQKKIISGTTCQFDTGNLPRGIYIMALSTSAIHNVKKFVIPR